MALIDEIDLGGSPEYMSSAKLKPEYTQPQQTTQPTSATQLYSQPAGPQPAPAPTNTRGGGDTSDRIPNVNGYYNEFGNWVEIKQGLQDGYNSDAAAIDEIYNTLLSGYGQTESRLGRERDDVLAQAQRDYELQQSLLKSQEEKANQQLSEQDIEAEKRRQTGENKQRRLYSDLVTSGIQRFGGASSAGEGYQSLLGREQQRASAERFGQYTAAKREIEQTKFNLQRDIANEETRLLNAHQTAKDMARREYEAKLDQINNMRNAALAEKRAAKLSALQQMRAQIQQIDVSLAQANMALQQQAAQAATNLKLVEDNFAQQYGGVEQAASNVSADASTNLSMGQSSNVYTQPEYTGQINQDEDDRSWLQRVLGLGGTGSTPAYSGGGGGGSF